jgi:hypothetical protein
VCVKGGGGRGSTSHQHPSTPAPQQRRYRSTALTASKPPLGGSCPRPRLLSARPRPHSPLATPRRATPQTKRLHQQEGYDQGQQQAPQQPLKPYPSIHAELVTAAITVRPKPPRIDTSEDHAPSAPPSPEPKAQQQQPQQPAEKVGGARAAAPLPAAGPPRLLAAAAADTTQ